VKANVKKTSKRTSASRKRSVKRREPQRAAPHVAALVAFADLARAAKLRWYVFGAQAVNVHGFPRATADLDITIDLGARTPASLVRALREAGFVPRFADEHFVATTRVIPVVHRDSALPIDVVLAGPGLEQQFLDEVELHRIGRRSIPILSLENLIVTKMLAGRTRDLEDVRELIARRSVDHARIEALLELIEDALGQSDLRPAYRKLRS
jgi:hypothetical protein